MPSFPNKICKCGNEMGAFEKKCKQCITIAELKQQIASLTAELAATKAEWDELREELEHYRGIAMIEGAEKALADYQALREEVERLKEAKVKLNLFVKDQDHTIENKCDEIEVLQQTAERYRKALERIASILPFSPADGFHCKQIAANALEGK